MAYPPSSPFPPHGPSHRPQRFVAGSVPAAGSVPVVESVPLVESVTMVRSVAVVRSETDAQSLTVAESVPVARSMTLAGYIKVAGSAPGLVVGVVAPLATSTSRSVSLQRRSRRSRHSRSWEAREPEDRYARRAKTLSGKYRFTSDSLADAGVLGGWGGEAGLGRGMMLGWDRRVCWRRYTKDGRVAGLPGLGTR